MVSSPPRPGDENELPAPSREAHSGGVGVSEGSQGDKTWSLSVGADAVKASWLFLWVNTLILLCRRGHESSAGSKAFSKQHAQRLSPAPGEASALSLSQSTCRCPDAGSALETPLLSLHRVEASPTPLCARPRLPHSRPPERPPRLPRPLRLTCTRPRLPKAPHGFPYSPTASHTTSTFSPTSANIRLSGSAVKYGGSLNKKKTETDPKPEMYFRRPLKPERV